MGSGFEAVRIASESSSIIGLLTSQYGETDAGLKRGNPLRLCPDMMAKLRRMWLNHGICDEIAHKMESVHMYMATPWASL